MRSSRGAPHLPSLMIIAILFSLFAGAPASRAQPETITASRSDLTGATPLPLTGKRRAAFEAYIAEALYRFGVPGAAIAVVQNGDVVYLNGFGVKKVGSARPVTPDTLMMIGSITKSMTTMLAGTLVDDGRLTWETRLVDLLPAFAVGDPALTSRLAIRDAFCNCSGIPSLNLNTYFTGLTPQSVVTALVHVKPIAGYGKQFIHNNLLIGSGGYALGVADGGSGDLGLGYDMALRERVLGPIGMGRSTFDPGTVLADGDYALPHAVDLLRRVAAAAPGSRARPAALSTRGRTLVDRARNGAVSADRASSRRCAGRYPDRVGRKPGGNLGTGGVSAQLLQRTAANGRDHDELQPRLAHRRVSRPPRRQPCRGHRGIRR
jgi:CubicO group peptidase (beta-lactamase class C family)